jgi:acetyl esterase
VPFDPQVRAYLDRRAEADTAPLYTLTVEQARAADLRSVQQSAAEPEPVHEVTERDIPGPGGALRIRIYRPSGADALPALVYLFGGGWVLGTIDTSDGICRALTNLAGCVTVSVGYRPAPEHRFPAAVHDCHAAVRWVAEHADELGIDGSRIAVGGDSAGGNLSAAVTLLARDGGPALVHQLLVYPNTDYRSDTPSAREITDPLLFNRHSVDWYWRAYLASPDDGDHPLASPLRADDLGGLPPATVITAEYDPLRDQGEQYAQRLAEAGVPVRQVRFDGMIHGFFAMTGVLDAAGDALRLAAGRLREAFAVAAAAGRGAS